MNLIFDSNVFDDILLGKLPVEVINRYFKIFLTHIQIDELNKCRDAHKRACLFLLVAEVKPEIIPTESFVIGVSRVGSAKLSDASSVEKIRKGNAKRTNDALIGEVAIKNQLTLVTNDKQLKTNIIELGGNAISVNELIALSKAGGTK